MSTTVKHLCHPSVSCPTSLTSSEPGPYNFHYFCSELSISKSSHTHMQAHIWSPLGWIICLCEHAGHTVLSGTGRLWLCRYRLLSAQETTAPLYSCADRFTDTNSVECLWSQMWKVMKSIIAVWLILCSWAYCKHRIVSSEGVAELWELCQSHFDGLTDKLINFCDLLNVLGVQFKEGKEQRTSNCLITTYHLHSRDPPKLPYLTTPAIFSLWAL